MHLADIVWRKLPSREARYPYVRLGISWPQTVSASNPFFQRAVEEIYRRFPGHGTAFAAGEVPAGTASLIAGNGPSSLLVHVARGIEVPIRDSLAELHRIAPSHAGPDWIEFPVVDELMELAVLQASYRVIVEAAASAHSQTQASEWIANEIGKIQTAIGRQYPKDPVTSAIIRARLRRIPCQRISGHIPIYCFGHGARQKQIWKGFSSLTSYLGVISSTNKTLAIELLRRAGLPVPKQRTVDTWEMARQAAAEIGFPVVIKPQTTDFGTAVETGITTELRLREAFEEARKHGSVLVESHIAGSDYRILVMNGKALRAYRRTPAHIIGNGIDTVAELIDRTAAERLKIRDLKPYAFARKDDPQVLAMLEKQGLSLSSVPRPGIAVLLRSNANVSTGGTTVSVADIIHPDNLRLAERAALVMGLDIAGIDFISPDVSVSWLENGAGICEVNPTPGMPYAEDADRLLDFITDQGRSNLRVPVFLFIGSKEEIDACEERLDVLAQASSMTLTTVKSNAVFQRRRQITRTSPNWKMAAEIALLDHLTDALLVCHESPDLGEFPIAIDAADLAFVSKTACAGLDLRNRRMLEDSSAVVIEGDEMQFRERCRQLMKSTKLQGGVPPRDVPT